MDLPLLVPVPPAPVRVAIPNDAWAAVLDAWILLTELRVHTPDEEFGECATAHSFSLPFLASYFAAHGDVRVHGAGHDSRKTRRLRKSVFDLTRRYYLDTVPADGLLDWTLLGDLSQCYHTHTALRELLAEVWHRYSDQISASVEKGKNDVMLQLQKPSSKADEIVTGLRRLTILASTLPQIGHVLMTGSDYLDALYDAYSAGSTSALRSALTANAYVGLTSLLKTERPNFSLLLDHLFTLKVAARVGSTTKDERRSSLLSDLVCSTDILVRIERYLTTTPQKRGEDLVSSLRAYRQEMKQFHHRHQRHKKRTDKGKAAVDVSGVSVLHAHKLSLITQVQDLFPDLGAGYVLRLLDFYGDNVETIIAHLLEDSLPTELRSLNKSEPLPDSDVPYDALEPRHTPDLPQEPEQIPIPEKPAFTRNIDTKEDPLIQAALSADAGKKLHFGRAATDTTADTLLADRSQHATNKAAILSALAAFDSDDDERDDTYDVADVGGTVDASAAESEDKRSVASSDETDMTLYQAWKATPALFARDSNTRRSQPRAALKREMGMTDEAIEGWAVMLQRDPRKMARLESKLALQGGVAGGAATGQPSLAPTAYRKPTKLEAGSEDEEGASDGDRPSGNARGRGRGQGQGQGQGRGGGSSRGGRGRGGRGGGRGRGANHHRRDQHAKKMARAMPAS